MTVLVRDVSDFMTPGERAMPPETGIPRYNRRLAQIYQSEEVLGGLPMQMEHFHLFDPEHRSSRPLCTAYHAAKLTDPDQAEAFLFRLRAATILEERPTTHQEVLVEIAEETGLDRETFLRHLTDGSGEQALESDLLLARNLGIHALPAFWLTGGNKGMLLPFLTDADALSRVIDQIIEAEEMHDAANGIS